MSTSFQAPRDALRANVAEHGSLVIRGLALSDVDEARVVIACLTRRRQADWSPNAEVRGR